MMNELRRAYLENVELFQTVAGLPICLEVSPDFKLDLMGIVAKQSPTVTDPSMFMGLTVKVVDDLDEPYRFVYHDAEKPKPFCIY